MQIAFNIRIIDDTRQLAVKSMLDFSSVFPHFRGNKREIEGFVDFLLVIPSDFFLSFENSVFRYLQSFFSGHGPEFDVVRFGAGEILESGSVFRFIDDPQIDLSFSSLGRNHHRCFGLTCSQDTADTWKLGEVADDFSPPLTSGQDIDVSHGFFHPSKRACGR